LSFAAAAADGGGDDDDDDVATLTRSFLLDRPRVLEGEVEAEAEEEDDSEASEPLLSHATASAGPEEKGEQEPTKQNRSE
jgi:hypothetical protein